MNFIAVSSRIFLRFYREAVMHRCRYRDGPGRKLAHAYGACLPRGKSDDIRPRIERNFEAAANRVSRIGIEEGRIISGFRRSDLFLTHRIVIFRWLSPCFLSLASFLDTSAQRQQAKSIGRTRSAKISFSSLFLPLRSLDIIKTKTKRHC